MADDRSRSRRVRVLRLPSWASAMRLRCAGAPRCRPRSSAFKTDEALTPMASATPRTVSPALKHRAAAMATGAYLVKGWMVKGWMVTRLPIGPGAGCVQYASSKRAATQQTLRPPRGATAEAIGVGMTTWDDHSKRPRALAGPDAGSILTPVPWGPAISDWLSGRRSPRRPDVRSVTAPERSATDRRHRRAQ